MFSNVPIVLPPKEEEEIIEFPITEIDAVTIESKDGYLFVISREICERSPVFKTMFTSSIDFDETRSKYIRLDDFRGKVIEIVLDFLYTKVRIGKDCQVTPKFNIPNDLLLEALILSDFLML